MTAVQDRATRPTGAWLPGDPVGNRRFADLGALDLENRQRLETVRLAYETWGELNADASNAVLVLHALTGDSHVCGDAGPGHRTAGWWPHLVGPGRPIDTNRFFVIAPNILGGCQGSTGPASQAPDGAPYGSRFPHLTTRDQVAAERLLQHHLGIDAWALVIGGSMGGMRAVEWAVTHPDDVERLAVIATSARASGDVIAWNSAQIAAIEAHPGFAGGDYHHLDADSGPAAALGVARRIAHTTYRTAVELDTRFGNGPQADEDPVGTRDGRFRVTSYLDHHADKLARRFDAGSYTVLARAMSTHDVGRGRGGIPTALSRITARTLVAAVDSDRLFPVTDSQLIARHIPNADLLVIDSPAGHDGFLLDSPPLNRRVEDLLRDADGSDGEKPSAKPHPGGATAR
ncbi:homoserine O-acetyltransferase MetX [Helcobacillus massiliensis]|uniref:Homoserine O-acetyltransferase n=1 Tax=Helcobacillus massiliensis TaxID=521392 RepID=A0A839QWA9_9MICO|nr:homoserine O-acetyltransferase [Helcobacillus massiliensis]MBB3022281.1 homoserine O-acetyltransferase [Helcobacillus massiliensis]